MSLGVFPGPRGSREWAAGCESPAAFMTQPPCLSWLQAPEPLWASLPLISVLATTWAFRTLVPGHRNPVRWPQAERPVAHRFPGQKWLGRRLVQGECCGEVLLDPRCPVSLSKGLVLPRGARWRRSFSVRLCSSGRKVLVAQQSLHAPGPQDDPPRLGGWC